MVCKYFLPFHILPVHSVNMNLCQTASKTLRGEKFTNSFYEISITLIPKPEKNTTRKKKLQASMSVENRYKNSHQNTSKPNSRAH